MRWDGAKGAKRKGEIVERIEKKGRDTRVRVTRKRE